ncbi:ATP-grasp domain-containing protein [Noviherbaspirillum sp. UKPF54]|uniref:ATP-grasp domain-containing protein n=1 Tax=Noviherbaspirillum sp. UKPF54 TaxID=2601898 RepID=UPI0011B188A3|nr:ATP-grasp domain-containing protein [Noviherbaspirillum sp. UKPF54]QDZ26747.1 ATP-grasp domain-containing protein [Noviherbaspirillum sp. UKPF54]
MINFIVVGKCKRVVSAVLQAIRSFTDAKCVVIGSEATASLRWSSLCKRQFTMDMLGADDVRFVQAVNAIVKRTPHVVLIPADCDAIRLVNRVRGQLQLRVTPIPDLATLDMFDNKWLFYQFCTRHGLPVPATRFIGAKSALDYDAVAAEFGVPFVVKPLNQAGSTGVQIIRSKAQFDTAILNDASYDYGPLIVQRYIDGTDIDVSFLAIGGRLCAFAVQQSAPSKIVFVQNAELEALAARLCHAGAYHGVMHVDARIDAASGKVYLIESNPRFWATLTASVWCGLNFVAESILQAPRLNGALCLTSGTASTRHPLIRPSSWRQLIGDAGWRGRLLRAVAFDLPTLRDFARELPQTGMRYLNRRAGMLLKEPDAMPAIPELRGNSLDGAVH